MRRLVKHAAAGVGAAALTVAVGVTVLGNATSAQVIQAVPATVTTTTATDVSASSSPSSDPALGADRGTVVDRATREAQRVKIVSAAARAADARAAKLGSQQRAIVKQQLKAKAAKAKAAAEAKRAEEARQKAIAAQGYEEGVTDPREMARQILKNKFGYGDSQFTCFSYIIKHESNWNVHATNASSGAYGLPQSLPGSKMASVASDWRTNPATQIIWAVKYMDSRYGSPCGARGYWGSHHNY